MDTMEEEVELCEKCKHQKSLHINGKCAFITPSDPKTGAWKACRCEI